MHTASNCIPGFFVKVPCVPECRCLCCWCVVSAQVVMSKESRKTPRDMIQRERVSGSRGE